MGTHSGELWWNSGANNFPFERQAGGFLELGMKGGLTKLDNSEFWLANDNTWRRMVGQTPTRISTHSVEEFLRTYLSTAYGFSYTVEGHLIVVLKFLDEATWCYDVTTGEIHERASYGQSDWRVNAALEIGGVTYVQDAVSGKVGILDPATYAEWDDPLVAAFTYAAVYAGGREVFHNRFELIFEAGVGLASGQGSDPEVMLEFSDDGGRTFKFAPNRKLGKIGQYKWRAFWTALGRSRDRVYRVSVSDPVKLVVLDTTLDAETGEA